MLNKQRLNANAVGANCIRPHFEAMAKNKQKGITLIALIITIIVMLILVGVTVNMAINGGLFTTAREATFKTEISQIQEALETKKVIVKAQNGGQLTDLVQTNTFELISNRSIDLEISDKLKEKYGSKIGIGKKAGEEVKLYYDNNSDLSETEKEWLREIDVQPWSDDGTIPNAFNWRSVDLIVDTDAEYIFNNSVVLKFFTDGILTVKLGEIEMLRIDATNSDNIENGKIKYSGVVNGQDAIVKLENNESNIDATIIWLEEDGTEGETQIQNFEKTILAIGEIYDKTYKGQVFTGGSNVNLYVTFKENPKIALITTKSPTEVEWSDLAFYPYEYTIDSENLIITVENFDNIVFSIRGDRIYANQGTELKFLDYSYFDYYTPEKCDVIDTNSLYYNFENGTYTSSYGYVGISIENNYIYLACNNKFSAVSSSTDDGRNGLLGRYGIRITEEGKLWYSKDGGEEVELTLIEQF